LSCLLTEVLCAPNRALGLDYGQYGRLIRQGRSASLLGTLCLVLERENILEQIELPVRRHLTSARVVYGKQTQDLAYELKWLKQALAAADEKLVLLKGAAYLAAKLPVSSGRLLSDVDILVPADRIGDVENSLKNFGWKSGKQDHYNERYYREWMHEIPPMGHPKRGSTVDLHHTILPPTAKPNVNASLLFDELVEIQPDIYTLSPRDMVIHSATHLFHEGEFHRGLRDLWDLDQMLRDFSDKDPFFWDNLVPRARELDLLDSVFHGLTYTRQVFGTPIPAATVKQASSLARKVRKPAMDFLFHRAFLPDQPECRLLLTGAALNALYIRSHYLRMPLHLLIPHLVRKAWMKRRSSPSVSEQEALAE
jgi:putative nucleotidyltransferase-like protein